MPTFLQIIRNTPSCHTLEPFARTLIVHIRRECLWVLRNQSAHGEWIEHLEGTRSGKPIAISNLTALKQYLSDCDMRVTHLTDRLPVELRPTSSRANKRRSTQTSGKPSRLDPHYTYL